MEGLPNEIIEIILSSKRLTYENILNFGATCKHFNDLVHHSSYIWKNKYQQRYPQFVKLFPFGFNDWYAEILNIYKSNLTTHKLLSIMSAKLYNENQLSDCDFVEWADLMQTSPRMYHYIALELINILHDFTPIKSIKVVPVDTPGNMTLQYYAGKVLRFIRQKHLSEVWLHFEQLPLQEQLLERGATLIAQWCQTTATFEWEDIAKQLDDLAKDVIQATEIEFPNHPLLNVAEETLLSWKLYNLDENQWNIIECRQLLKCITEVIYTKHSFSGNSVDYYKPENSYINEVLRNKQGLPITLAVIFESIARRVGLKCEPYAFPSHFLLKFTEGKGNNTTAPFYIDVFNDGNLIRKGSCPRNMAFALNPHRTVSIATPKEVVERMANNLELSFRQFGHPRSNLTTLRSILELIYTINPQNLQLLINLARFYMMHGIDTKHLKSFLLSDKFICQTPEQGHRVVHMLQEYELHRKNNFSEPIVQTTSKTRPVDLLYAVGMIVKHVVIDSNCVIYDWDPTCMASLDWQNQTGIHHLQNGRIQPFYKVLVVGDGAYYYAPQEHLAITDPIEMPFAEKIGKYFSHFFQTHYVPNAEKESEYADDAEVRYMYHQQLQFGAS